MIRVNEYVPQSSGHSGNREDNLLKRLKQCVGQIEIGSKDNKRISSNRLSQKYQSKQIIDQQIRIDRRKQTKQTYSNAKNLRQNKTDTKYLIGDQGFNKFSNSKSNFQSQIQERLILTNKYSQNDNLKSYGSIDRKQSLPLRDVSNISNIQRVLFKPQNQSKIIFSQSKDISNSTKRNITERKKLINDQNIKITPEKKQYQSTNKNSDEDCFLQRLSLRKINYLDDVSEKNIKKNLQNRQDQLTISLQKSQNNRQYKMNDNYNSQSTNKQIQIQSTRINSQKYQNYSKITMQNLVKDNDIRKGEKMQKLRKITDMNQEINKRIKNIVDTFENYLTHRQI